MLACLTLPVTTTLAAPFKCPHVGGDFVFAQEANPNTLDQMTSTTISTRNIAMNIYESLMTRDENNHPILELAEAMIEAPDHLTYTFKLRRGIHFHNGKLMTSADVVASFDRYARVGNQRGTLNNVGSLGCAGRFDIRSSYEEDAADIHRGAVIISVRRSSSSRPRSATFPRSS